ncbi:unnamed protein product (macronuclear) [Paramecium tetraurelia]|uniref:ATPase AAA-type core domain-containing protein n=1 Tax=Paramecium tetraurelia TaxID=5888 RepID=A0C4I1_PARTE|nr:uncharacterized protein GSPATT00035178001 [Paramecium tetraurelia]CAK65698.1 unnamed protein product [Paramecium tetraurelia]|eukprot:XP_001433095.1 hypothetical protein (macronuclear) [Paramecium tetraurelia strain d4-2]
MEALQIEMDPLIENQVKQNLKLVRPDQEWFVYYGKLYLFYVDAYKSLETCYDQLLHPQKRRLLKKMLENTMLRQIQIKQAMIFYSTQGNVIRSDFVNLHQVIFDEKRLIEDTEVSLPHYFSDEQNRKLAYRKQMLNHFLNEFHDTTQPEEEVLVDKAVLENIEQAIWFIQKNERGRQGIERVLLAKQLKKQEIKKQEKQKKLQEGLEVHDSTEREEAITTIQKYYRGFKAREIVWDLREQESLFLGFTLEKQLQETDAYKTYHLQREKMKEKQQERLQEYKTALVEAKDNLMNDWQDDIQNQMLAERRRWYMSEVQKAEGKLVPPKVAQFYKKDQVRLPLTEEEQEMMDLLDKEKKAAKKNKGKKKKKKKQEDEDIRVEQGPTEAIVKMQDLIEKHNHEWRNDQLNPYQKHENSLLKGEIAKGVEKQIREVVDEMIDMELINLRIALKAKKMKYPKKKKSKKKKAKPAAKAEEDDLLEEGEINFGFRSVAKKKKKKFPGDKGTAKKDPRDMLAELIESGIAKKLEPAKISDLIGNCNPLRQKQEMLQEQVADPSIYDLRQVLVQFVGMPLGSPYIKDNVKESNYVLFYGPHGSGKTHAVRALQTECDALILDLSPANIENKYQDKPDYLLSLAFKTAACFQPAIIYIDEIERIFKGKKKKKKGDQQPSSAGGMNWVKLRKYLLKYGKYFTEKQKENVTIIGCSYAPWNANKKQMKSFFKRRVYFPCPNYATRIMIFQRFFEERKIQLHPNFPLSSLAHATEGFTAGNIKEALRKILTERRLILSAEIPYRISEFVDPLAVQQSTFLQQYQEFRKLHDDLSGNKARIDKLKKPADDEKGKKKPGKKKK